MVFFSFTCHDLGTSANLPPSQKQPNISFKPLIVCDMSFTRKKYNTSKQGPNVYSVYVKITIRSHLKSSLKSKYLTNGDKLASPRLPALISTASLGLRAPAYSVVHSQTASLQNQPVAPGDPSILLRLLFSLLTHIHPAWSTCQNLNLPPPLRLPLSSYPTPPPSFLCFTGLVKVSQSPVARLYRLPRVLVKGRLLSGEYPCKEWLRCSCLLLLSPFVWLFLSFTTHLSLGIYII